MTLATLLFLAAPNNIHSYVVACKLEQRAAFVYFANELCVRRKSGPLVPMIVA